MELHQLQYVLEVAKRRHFTKAAEEIGVAQSSLSQQITKLEEELGIKLFERTTRSVYPTPAGEEFLMYAKRILEDINTVKQSMQSHIGLTRGKITIGAITTLESIDFVALITAFHQTYPGLHLNIVTNGSYNLTQMMQTGVIELALLTPPSDIACNDLEYFPLANDEFVLITASSTVMAKNKSIDLAACAQEKFIFPSPDQSIHKIYLSACVKAGFSPNIVCQSGHSETTLALVAAGMGISFFPLDTLLAANHPGVAIVRLAAPIKKHLSMVLPKRSFYSPPVIAFRNFVLEWVKSRLVYA